MTLNSITSLTQNDILKNSITSELLNKAQAIGESDKKEGTFASYLSNAIEEVNKDQLKAYEAMEDIALNKTDNLQEAVQKIQEAELSLKLALEIQNKAIGAYKDIMRTQV